MTDRATPDLSDLTEAVDAFDRAVLDRDADLARHVLDDDYALVLVHPSPAVVPRPAWLEVLADYVVHSWEVEAIHVDRYDDVATVLRRVEMRATVLGQDRSGPFVMSDTWLRRDGQWRVWRRHSTPLTAGDMPGA